MLLFLFGGVSGIIVASPPIDYHVHDSFFVVGYVAYRIAWELGASELHPLRTPVASVVQRTPRGGFQAERIRPGSE